MYVITRSSDLLQVLPARIYISWFASREDVMTKTQIRRDDVGGENLFLCY